MFGSSINYLFLLFILFIFKSKSVFSDCTYGRTCYSSYSSSTWCCPYDQVCGNSYLACDNESDLSPIFIAMAIVSSIFCFVFCLICCLRTQQQQNLRNSYANSNTRVVTNPYHQQHIRRGPMRVVHVRPIYHVGAVSSAQPYPSMYEAPPPSYEVATASLPTVHQSSSPAPVIATAQQSV